MSRLLSHYTGGDALVSILERSELWASHIYFMNDEAEYDHAFSLATDLLDRIGILRAYAARHPELANEVRAIETKDHGRPALVFVACFSEREDDLSQWRGYTRPGDAYALQFAFDGLVKLAEIKGWYFKKCLYGNDANQEVIRVLKFAFDRYDANPVPDTLRDVVAEVQSELLRVAPVLKNEGFRDEAEWRLITPIQDIVSTTMSFRRGASFMVPFIKIPFDRSIIANIWIGPGPNQALAASAVELANFKNGNPASQRRSQHSYRAW